MLVKERQRIRWNPQQKKEILDEAARLHLKNPDWNHLRLIREAQKILPIEDQRNLQTVGWGDSFRWFPDGFDAAVKRAKASEPGLEKAGLPEEPEYFPVNGTAHVEGAPVSEEASGTVALLTSLAAAMEELRAATTKSLPIGIVGRLDELQERLTRIENRFQDFMTRGLVFRLVPATEAAILAAPSIQKEEPPSVVVQKKEPPPSPVIPSKKTRKPRVVVLNTDSGHVQNGIRKGTEGYVSSIKFEQVYGLKVPEFKEFDYVLAYKKTPITWIQEAKKFYPPNKFRAVSGGSIPMAEAIKALPPIEIED